MHCSTGRPPYVIRAQIRELGLEAKREGLRRARCCRPDLCERCANESEEVQMDSFHIV